MLGGGGALLLMPHEPLVEKMLETDKALAGKLQRQEEARSGHSAEDEAKVWETVVADRVLAHQLEQQDVEQQELTQVQWL